MIAPRAGARVWVATRPVDFRLGINGLAAMVKQVLADSPYSGDIFVFRSKRSDRLKLLAWDGSGMVLATKWLEQGKFAWPAIDDGRMCLTVTQLALLMDGLAWTYASAPIVKTPVWVD